MSALYIGIPCIVCFFDSVSNNDKMCGNIKSKPRFYAWYWIYVPRIFNYAQFGGKEGRLAVCRKIAANNIERMNFMKYCTNCGKESTKRICPHCGVKQNSIHNFCGWCGQELNENAVICPNCQTKVYQGIMEKIIKVIGRILLVVSLIFIVMGDTEVKIQGIFLLAAALILMPFLSNIIGMAFGNKYKKTLLSSIRLIAAAVIVCAGFTVVSIPSEPPSIKSRVYDEAIDVFHQNVRLKNEQSFTVNSYSTITDENYNDSENLTRYIITIDYSAQNGFGGMGRDEYTVGLLYDKDTDSFSTLSAHE